MKIETIFNDNHSNFFRKASASSNDEHYLVHDIAGGLNSFPAYQPANLSPQNRRFSHDLLARYNRKTIEFSDFLGFVKEMIINVKRLAPLRMNNHQ